VGAWNSNPLSPSREEKRAALENCENQLALADRIGARCCVNVAGSHSPQWDGPSADAFGEEVFAEVVETVREIIDAVKPARTAYSLETMPWMVPHSPENYRRLLDAVDRPAFAVHLDTVNLINSPERYCGNAALTRECFDLLGPRIAAIHVKDIILRSQLTVHLDECLVGEGGYDLPCLLRCAAGLDKDIPLLVEHIKVQEDYKRSVAALEKMIAGLGLS
jgi:sugar phosphate isomerase/epimerase